MYKITNKYINILLPIWLHYASIPTITRSACLRAKHIKIMANMITTLKTFTTQ